MNGNSALAANDRTGFMTAAQTAPQERRSVSPPVQRTILDFALNRRAYPAPLLGRRGCPLFG